MKEIWKDIEGYDGRYQISNMGRVKSFAQDKTNGRIKKNVLNDTQYYTIDLTDSRGVRKNWLVHRLVAIAFMPNPYGLPDVNHKDESRTNNCVDNLEWCDANYNNNYGTRNERLAKANRNNPLLSCKVYSVDEQGNKEYFDSIMEASRVVGCPTSNIGQVLRGTMHRSGGRKWFYCDGYEGRMNWKGRGNVPAKAVEAFNPSSGERLIFKSQRAAARYFGVCFSAVNKWVLGINKPTNGFIFSNADESREEVAAS